MSKSFLFRWFGLGRLPRAMKPILESEGIHLVEEGVSGTIAYRNFRAPGRRHGYRVSWFLGSLVTTGLRFAAFGYHKPLVNIPRDSVYVTKIECALENDDALLLVRFEASDFHDDWSGTIEIRFRTEKAREFLDRIQNDQRAQRSRAC